jgi:hypothetical protein
MRDGDWVFFKGISPSDKPCYAAMRERENE